MYVSGLEISRAAAASHKVGKEKRGPRDFKSEKRARSFVQKRFGVIFCSCSSNCVNVYVYMGLSTLVYDRNHYFGLGPIPKRTPKSADTLWQIS